MADIDGVGNRDNRQCRSGHVVGTWALDYVDKVDKHMPDSRGTNPSSLLRFPQFSVSSHLATGNCCSMRSGAWMDEQIDERCQNSARAEHDTLSAASQTVPALLN